MADQRSPSDHGTGGKDPEDYPQHMGPVPVGKAPVNADKERGEPLLGVAPPLNPVQKRERTEELARYAIAQEELADSEKRKGGTEPKGEGTDRQDGS